MNATVLKGTPLEKVNYSFLNYVEQKKEFEKKHLGGNGLPDYAYKMDYEHRKRLDSMPGVYNFARKCAATMVPQFLQKNSMQGVFVGPNQYPEVYQMVKECAETLGIGIPNMLIVPAIDFGDGIASEFNAVTMAYDDVEPVIVMTGLMLERFTAQEVKAIIGHECGHIHNNHGIYTILQNIIVNIGINGLLRIPGIAQIGGVLTSGVQLAILMWSRAAEISADRAGLICCGDLEVAKSANAKFMYNGADISGSIQTDLNIEALKEQMQLFMDSPYRLNEVFYSHPLSIKRVLADIDFWQCETYYQWRPDLRQPNMRLCTKDEVDERCKSYLDVVMPKGAK